jgi:hypothetical protein
MKNFNKIVSTALRNRPVAISKYPGIQSLVHRPSLEDNTIMMTSTMCIMKTIVL